MDFEEINNLIIIIGFALFIFFAILILISQKKKDKELIRARVFLNEKFLFKNLTYILIGGSLIAVHEFIEILVEKGLMQNSYDHLSESFESLSIIFLFLWMFTWWKIYKK